jgi:hypothetical protein
MKRLEPRKKQVTAVWITALCCTLVLAWSLTAGAQSRGMEQRRGPGESRIKVGEVPPDFELPMLKFGTDREGRPVGIINEKETIRLSSFFGKRPVCMIMSSYT